MHPKLIEIVTQDAVALFRLDESQLFDLKVRYGCRFLENLYGGQPHIEKALKSHPNFWTWWIELWAIRDRQLIKACRKTRYGVDYSFPVNTSRETTVPLMRTKEIFTDELMDFYEDCHYWSRVKFYPNEEMISQCLTTAPEMELEKIKC